MENAKRDRKTFAVDKIAVRNELLKRGLTFKSASLKMGYSQAYLATMLGSENPHLPQTVLLLLWKMFGIPSEVIGKSYAPKDEPKRIEPCATTVPRVDLTKPFVAPEAQKPAPVAPVTMTAVQNDTMLDVLRLVYNTMTVFCMELNRIIDKAKGE